MSRSKTSVRFLVEEGVVVRGTMDPAVALSILCLSDELDESPEWDERGFQVFRPRHELPEDHPRYYMPQESTFGGKTYPPMYDPQPDPEAVRAFGDMLHDMLEKDCSPGWYRWNPATQADRDYEGVSQWLAKCAGPGSGRFPGVAFY